MKLNLLFCGLLMLAVSVAIVEASPHGGKSKALKNTVILIIRHAEKPEAGNGLSAEGKARAKAYENYFKGFTMDGQPLKLDYLFAAADSKESHRARLTIEPTGQALGIAIDSRYKNKEFQALANKIKSKFHGSAILISWHHDKIPALLSALGVDPSTVVPKGKWPDDVFDWLIQLRYDQSGRLADAKRIIENLPHNSKPARETH
jgi:hypothetical protein